MCKTGNELRAAFYRVSVIVNDMADGEAREAVEANRGQPEYRMALAKYVEHVQSCPECKKWRVK